MSNATNQIGSFSTKLIACLLILVCLALGAVGLILPIIPGLLFLAIAAMIIAKHSTTADRWLRRNRTVSSYLDSADGFTGLDSRRKIQYGVLLCLKMLIEGVAFATTAVIRLVSFSIDKYRAYR